MLDILCSDRPENYFRFLTCFFAFGVNGAGGDESMRRSASSARFKSASDTGGRASFRDFSICGS